MSDRLRLLHQVAALSGAVLCGFGGVVAAIKDQPWAMLAGCLGAGLCAAVLMEEAA